MNERIRIGQRIREIRQNNSISQEILAEMTGLKQANIARIESGRYSTGLDILAKIATALGCDIDFVEKENINNKLRIGGNV